MTRRMTFIIIILLLASFEMGMLVGDKLGPKGSSQDKTYQDGWNAAKKRLSESGFVPANINAETKIVSGQITEIKGSDLYLKIRPLAPLADPALDNRVVKTDGNTKFYKLIKKNSAVYQKEVEQYSKTIQAMMKNPPASTPSAIMPPEMFTKEEAKFSDLKAGQQLTAVSNNNILEAREIKAVEISIQDISPITAADTSAVETSIASAPTQPATIPNAPASMPNTTQTR